MSQKEFKCDYCPKMVKWAKEYVKGSGPLNLDGSKHNCKKEESDVVDEPITTTKTCPFANHADCRPSCALYVSGKHCTFYRE